MVSLKLPEELVEMVRQYSGAEDSAKMKTSRLIAEFWQEGGEAIAHHLKITEKSAHKKFIESLAGSVKVSPSSLYNRSRVGRNVVMRGYSGKHDIFTFGQWLSLLRNLPSEKGLVSDEDLTERIEWMYTEAENHGGEFPSVRDIESHSKQNGHKPEDQIYWKRIVTNARKMVALNDYSDARQMAIVIEVDRLQQEIEQEDK
jgi:hypothetical protein